MPSGFTTGDALISFAISRRRYDVYLAADRRSPEVTSPTDRRRVRLPTGRLRIDVDFTDDATRGLSPTMASQIFRIGFTESLLLRRHARRFAAIIADAALLCFKMRHRLLPREHAV